MARPREFNAEEALSAAMRVFWEHGFQATTMQNLVDATGVQRASLYRIFGNKAAIFAASLERYSAWRASRIDPGLSPRAALRQWLELAVSDARAGSVPRGCLLVRSTSEHGSLGPAQQEVVSAHLARLETFFALCVSRAAPGADAPAVASALLAANIGLFVLSRAGASPEKLSEVVEQAMRLIPD